MRFCDCGTRISVAESRSKKCARCCRLQRERPQEEKR